MVIGSKKKEKVKHMEAYYILGSGSIFMKIWAAAEEMLSPVLQEPLAGATAINNTGVSLELLWIKRKNVPLYCSNYMHTVKYT